MIPSEKRLILFLSAGTMLWCVAYTLAPVIGPENPLGQWLYFFFSPICHQLPLRSFHLLSEPMAVCSRCAGIYYGFLVALIVYPRVRSLCRRIEQSLKVLIFASLPMIIDVIISRLGILSNNYLHALTGVILGSVSFCFILPPILEWIGKKSLAEGKPYGTDAQ